MARRDRPVNRGAELRAAILAEVRDQAKGAPDFLRDFLYDLGALERGERATVRRWDLPPWCAQAHAGAPGDDLTLTEGNELIEEQ